MNAVAEKKTLTVAEAAAIIGIARPTLYQAIQRGEFPALRFGRRVMVPMSAVENFLAGVGTQNVEAKH